MPHPYLVPVRPRFSRRTQSRGVEGSTSSFTGCRFTLKEINGTPPSYDGKRFYSNSDRLTTHLPLTTIVASEVVILLLRCQRKANLPLGGLLVVHSTWSRVETFE